MLEIDKTLVSDLLFEKKFLCDLNACKGACCVEGDSGAPLEKTEAEYLENNIEKIKPFLKDEGIIETKGRGIILKDFDALIKLSNYFN